MRTERSVKSLPGTRRLSRPVVKSELDFNFVLGDRISYMNPTHWDELVAGKSLFLSRAYRETMEREGPRAIRARYGMVYLKDTPVAALMVNIVRLAGPRPPSEPMDLRRRSSPAHHSDLDDRAGQMSWETPARSVMFCGDFFVGGFHGVALRNERDLGKLWPALATLLHKIQLQEGHAREKDYIVIKDVPASHASDTRTLRQCQYRREDASPNMVLALSPRWKSYEDYLAHLNVRYRLTAVRAAREIYRQGYTSHPIADLAPWAQRLHELYLNVQRRSGAQLFPLPQGFLPALAARLDQGQLRCTGLFKEEALMGFVITLKDRDTAVCLCTGWDTEACGQAPIVSSLLHSVIGDALAMECHDVNFGRTALRLKAQLGAHPEQAELWVCHARPELDLALAPLLGSISHAPYGDQATPLPL